MCTQPAARLKRVWSQLMASGILVKLIVESENHSRETNSSLALRVGVASRRSIRHHRLEFDAPSLIVAKAELQRPVVGDFRIPVLWALANFYQQRVPAGGERDWCDEAVESRAVQPLLASKHFTTVDPH